MIFPAHRIREQLKKQADVTEEESRAIGAALVNQAQGVIAPEDFFYLGHRLASGGLSMIAVVGQQNACGVRNRSPGPSEVIVEFISTKNDADLYLIRPPDMVAFGASNNIVFSDISTALPAGTATLFTSETTDLISRTAAAPVGIFVGPIPAISARPIRLVIREGYGFALVGPVNVADKFFFDVREVDLRVR